MVTLAAAREQALAVRRLARAGIDPQEALKPKQVKVDRVRDLIDRYSKQHLQRNNRSGKNVEKLLALHVFPRWGDRELSSITRTDFATLLEEVRLPKHVTLHTKSGSYSALRGGAGSAAEVRKWVRAMFEFAFDADLLPANPLADFKNRDRVRKRERVLSMDELKIVWDTAGKFGHPWGHYFQLIMLTGNRRSEWANAEVSWLTMEQSYLEIPAASYKTDKAHVIPLSRQAKAIVSAMPLPKYGPYILSTMEGARPISDFSGAKLKLDAQIAVDCPDRLQPWVVHDLRRSMATHMERIGIAPHVIEVCLGHTIKGIAATYRHYSYLTEKSAALQLWADELAPEH